MHQCTAVLTLCSVALAAPVCAGGFEGFPDFKPSSPFPISVTMATDKAQYRVGEPVTFLVCARNVSDQAQELNFATEQEFDVTVGQGSIYSLGWSWQWSRTQKFADLPHKWRLLAGETKVFRATWDQKMPGWGTPAPRGTHRAIAMITTKEGIRSNLVDLTLAE